MENTSVYYRQLVLHAQSIEGAIESWKLNHDYHKKMVELSEKQLIDMQQSLKITKEQIALEEQGHGKA